MVHKTMLWQVLAVLSCVVWCVDCSGQYKNYIKEQEELYYTANPYAMSPYSKEEFQALWYMKDSKELNVFIEKLNDKFDQWSQAALKPVDIWNNYRNNCLNDLDSLNSKVREKLNCYYNEFGNLLRAPRNVNFQDQLKKAHKALQDDKQVQDALCNLAWNRYSNFNQAKISEHALKYKAFLDFILDNTQMVLFHVKVKKLQNLLNEWEKAEHPSGITLWNAIVNNHKKELATSNMFAYKQNQEVIKAFLNCINDNKNNLYSLSFKAIQETIPYGRKLLFDVLYELGKETQDQNIDLLKTYCRFIDLELNRGV